MIKHIISHETKTLLRSGWMGLLILFLMAVVGFAIYNGAQQVDKRTADIENALSDLAKSDETMLSNIKLVEEGKETGLSYWLIPTEPSVVGSRHPRIAAMNAQPLAMISTGQSDVFAHYMSTSTRNKGFDLDYSEMSNPVQLLFGTFDLAFVFVFIIPLLIIAFTYDVLSREKELGTLRVLGSQPISIIKWLTQKLTFRFILFAAVSTICVLLFLSFLSPAAFQDTKGVVLLILQIIAYELFWFVLAGVINIYVNDSSKNALYLIGLWFLIVLMIPVTANQLGASIYPSPSRLEMINAVRQVNRDLEKKQDEILDSYLREHPELAQTEGEESYSFWHRYYASQDVVQEEIQPLVDRHHEALRQQQGVISYLKYLSPAIITQESFNKIAGTSTADYTNYQEQVEDYASQWKEHIIPLLFKGEKYSKSTYDERPVFSYQPLAYAGIVSKNMIAVLVLSLIAGLFLLRRDPRRSLFE